MIPQTIKITSIPGVSTPSGSVKITGLGAPPAVPTPSVPPPQNTPTLFQPGNAPGTDPRMAQTGADILNSATAGVQMFGKALSTLDPTALKQADQINKANDAAKATLLKAIQNEPDPAKKAVALQHYQTIWGGATPTTAGDINPAFNLSKEQVVGSALETGADIVGAGADSLIPESAKATSAGARILQGAARGVLAATPASAAIGGARAMQGNGTPLQVAQGVAGGGVTGVVGGGLTGGLLAGASEVASGRTPTDPATTQAVANIADQEKGIPAPVKTPAQIAQESQQKTWEVIQPKISPSEMSDAAASGRIGRTGETGVVTQIPTKTDLANIELARPYVEAANGDPIKTVANIQQGIADEASKLRAAVGTQGGTFSVSNVKGVVNEVRVPLAIKNSAEMTQVENIKNYVAELASGVDKNPTGALDLSQQFRQGINNEFGENVWGKGTPISNYIKSVNKALNDFISTRLPDGMLPDGTLIKDSFAKQSQLYGIMEDIQLPKLGDAAINPTEATPLKVPGPALSETIKQAGKEHPIIKGAIKTAIRVAGIGVGVHLIP